MANGAVTYGSLTYTFDTNFLWGYTEANETVKVVNQTPTGKIMASTRFTRKVFVLPFRNISDVQLEYLEDIDAYSGLVTFYPEGKTTGNPSYTGLWQMEKPEKEYTDKNHVTITFTESVET